MGRSSSEPPVELLVHLRFSGGSTLRRPKPPTGLREGSDYVGLTTWPYDARGSSDGSPSKPGPNRAYVSTSASGFRTSRVGPPSRSNGHHSFRDGVPSTHQIGRASPAKNDVLSRRSSSVPSKVTVPRAARCGLRKQNPPARRGFEWLRRRPLLRCHRSVARLHHIGCRLAHRAAPAPRIEGRSDRSQCHPPGWGSTTQPAFAVGRKVGAWERHRRGKLGDQRRGWPPIGA